jgi:superfamily II DNA or RNA helicase
VQISNIKEGSRIEGIDPAGPVRVVAVQRSSSGGGSIIYRDAAGQLHDRVLLPGDAERLSLAASRHFSFDADGEDFRLGVEALRIHLAHLFDPMMAIQASNVEPLPHQVTAVYESMLPRQPLRFLLADDPGAGKTIMAGLYIRELALRSDAVRVLVIAPGGLVDQWQDELNEKFELPFTIFSRELDATSRTGNPFQEHDRLIVRLDQLSRSEELRDKAAAADWDLVVFDEAHKLSANYYGREIKKTQRYELGELLSSRTRHLLLMTATPHNGNDNSFQLFLALLDRDRFYGKADGKINPADVNDVMRRMIKEELLRFDGTRLFPERRAYTLTFELSSAEMALYEAVTDYVRHQMDLAEQVGGSRRRTVGFALTILQRRLASSPEAIFQSLKRRRMRLEDRLKQIRTGALCSGVAETLADYNVGHVPAPYADDEEFPDQDYEELEERLVIEASAAETAQELEKEINLLQGLEEQARRVVQSQQDRKWETLREVLEEDNHMRTPAGARRKLIIFTEHRDTLNYLQSRIATLIGNPEAVIAFHGGHSRDQRRALQERFRNDPETVVLIATDAAGEGVNLQNAHLMINYDLPWNPNRIEQRFGRIHRIGQTEVCHLWNLVAKETREGAVFERLFEKLDAEREALGGRVFDILGAALSGQSLRDMLIEAIRYGNDPEVRKKNLEKVGGALDREKLEQILRDNALCEQAMTPEALFQIREEMERAEARKLQPLFVQAFFNEAFRRLKGEMRAREAHRFEIRHVPAIIRERDKRIGSPRQPVTSAYERICFDKADIRLSGKPPASLIHPGHPLMRAVTDLTLETMRPLLSHGAMLLNPADEGSEPYLLALIDHSVRQAGASQGEAAIVSRRLHFCAIYRDRQVRSAGYAPHLDLHRLDANDVERLRHLLEEDWLTQTLEEQVLDYAQDTLVPQHFQEVNDRRQRIVKKTLDAVRHRLMSEINRLGDRYIKMREQVVAGRQPAVQAENIRRRVDELTARLRAREAELERSAHLEAASPVLLGAALVIPEGLLATSRGEPALTPDAAARQRIERIAMGAVMDYERSLGHEVKDVSGENCGWDVTAQPRANENGVLPPARHIEVKGRRADATTVTVSRNEIAQALNQGEKFWLAIVRVDGDAVYGPHYINQPFTQPPDWAETSKALDISKLLRRAGAVAVAP